MDVQRARNRARSPLSSGPVTARQTVPMENTSVVGINAPDTVEQGGTISATVTVQNSGVPTFASDSCIIGGVSTGVDLIIEFWVGGRLIDTREDCLQRRNQKQYNFTAGLTGGTGEIDIEFVLKGAQSGTTGDRQSKTITVGDDGGGGGGPQPGDPGCSSNADCPDGQKCSNGVCRECSALDNLIGNCSGSGGGFGGILGQIQTILILLIAVWVLTQFFG